MSPRLAAPAGPKGLLRRPGPKGLLRRPGARTAVRSTEVSQ